MEPTDIQREIIDREGNMVVMASPGSGKTFVISHKIRTILQKDELRDYQGVIAISYTRKASENLKNRTLEGGVSVKNSFFGTIDSFCLTQIILNYGDYAIGYPSVPVKPLSIYDLPDEDRSGCEWISKQHPDHDTISEEQWESLFALYKTGYVLVESLELLALYVFRNSLACRNYLKARFKYIFIDEYQDADNYTDALFHELVALGLTGVAVGDKNQSIFGFAHKDNRYLVGLDSDTKFSSFLLSQNFRCSPPIINYSNRLLDKDCELISCNEGKYEGVCYVLVAGGEENVAEYLSEQIPLLCEKEKVENRNQIAILVKTRKTQESIDKGLTIPHRLIESTSLDMDLNPRSRLYAEILQYYFEDTKLFLSVVDQYVDYDLLSVQDRKNLSDLGKEIKNIGEDNINKLPDLFNKEADILLPDLADDLSTPKLKEVLGDEKMLATYKPSSKDEVVLMTLHKAKGLEFDYVYHLNMNEWELPVKQARNGDFNDLFYPCYYQDLDLHYVGITRARKVCFLIGSTLRTNSRGGTSKASASVFLNINNLKSLRTNYNYSNGAHTIF